MSNNNITPFRIEAAARWLAKTAYANRPKPVLPFLRDRFCLSPAEIVLAIRRANEQRRRQ
ncbi:hypothetical protein EOB36_23260 [Mesorhizobium sp. M6A.T.Cr.TU.017.01.1.1]|uniref:hypothetical protein n=1 Tax=Mesorhizobium sp. M6A.T.Cr.TU.017.01.1.1 TaxID=2496774 RepID=UPI000FD4AB19|nr:hypothetical protein [Mesorhizobium sp. M6A.T.Cr.TU.017.01.1.1]RUU98604.1 hypothetical protein EOB36_23260 [Mesorhizobium sp. M6A.T.Cr.TU.017.01.1.1]